MDKDDVETYYDILGVPAGASLKQIKAAYYAIAQQYHPDKVPDHLTMLKKDAEERFKQLNEAYQTLSNSEKRKSYDTILAQFKSTKSSSSQPNSTPRSSPPPPPSAQNASSTQSSTSTKTTTNLFGARLSLDAIITIALAFLAAGVWLFNAIHSKILRDRYAALESQLNAIREKNAVMYQFEMNASDRGDLSGLLPGSDDEMLADVTTLKDNSLVIYIPFFNNGDITDYIFILLSKPRRNDDTWEGSWELRNRSAVTLQSQPGKYGAIMMTDRGDGLWTGVMTFDEEVQRPIICSMKSSDHAEFKSKINVSEKRLLGAWRNDVSILTLRTNGAGVLARSGEADQVVDWQIDGTLLRIDREWFRVWQLSDTNMVLTTEGREVVQRCRMITNALMDVGGGANATKPDIESSMRSSHAEQRRIAQEQQDADNLKIRNILIGTWRQDNRQWISFFEDGTCEVIDKGEDASGLYWEVNGRVITFESPGGQKSSYNIGDISESRYQITPRRNEVESPTLADAFNDKQSSAVMSGIKLESTKTQAERDQLHAANMSRARSILPGVWEMSNARSKWPGAYDDMKSVWRISADGTLSVMRTMSGGKRSADSYTWRVNGNVIELTNYRLRSGRGDPVEREYLILGIWDNYISGGKKGAYGIVFDGYSEMVRSGGIDAVEEYDAQKGREIESASVQLLGTWRDDSSAWTFNKNGECVIAADGKPRRTVSWGVAADKLIVGESEFKIWGLSEGRLQITDMNGVYEENPVLERLYVKMSQL